MLNITTFEYIVISLAILVALWPHIRRLVIKTCMKEVQGMCTGSCASSKGCDCTVRKWKWAYLNKVTGK